VLGTGHERTMLTRAVSERTSLWKNWRSSSPPTSRS
jgi:hypothetical protein